MKRAIAIGIDIGGTNSVIGFADKDGNILFRDSIRTDEYAEAEKFVKELSDHIQAGIDAIKDDCEIVGIGIGAPNGNFYKGTIEFAPNLRWTGVVPLVDLVKTHFDVPVVLTNDANAAAIGEMIYGAARGMKDFIVITLGTGLGSGIVINGKLVYGHDGFAGELGHVIVDPRGRLCGCGRQGCLETYVSATGITRTVIQMLEESDNQSILRGIATKEITSKKVYEAAKAGDSLAIEAFDFTCRTLGQQLADAVAFSSPQAIILFGGLANAAEFIFGPTKRYMEESMLKIFRDKVKLLPSQLPESDAAVLGAAALIWDLEK
jgi:glucokinase